MAMGYGYINFHILRRAPLGRAEASDFGVPGVIEATLLEHCAQPRSKQKKRQRKRAERRYLLGQRCAS